MSAAHDSGAKRRCMSDGAFDAPSVWPARDEEDDGTRDGALVVDDLIVRFGRHLVLDGLSLQVERGTTTVLLGPNGSGKSTLLRACLGVVRSSSGRLRVLGLDPQRHADRVQRQVGYVPDKPDVYGWMTADGLFRFLRPHFPTWTRRVRPNSSSVSTSRGRSRSDA